MDEIFDFHYEGGNKPSEILYAQFDTKPIPIPQFCVGHSVLII